ncbi:hypothetical protein FA95DRAFT_1683471 [Auriscalpium vulgare]|uniref:Uncharacterized protein n=1 Tax=Auriscalpium vulgare TaxID=40419 RepID=A0ACB8RAQ1_9AGAM|nr:hypothetical protein FA95DRAFT_1683471 [Auriscalpium vulgare]
MAEPPAQRVVPGAPPPAPLSKSQKKKRKTAKGKAEDSPATPTVSIPDTTAAALVDKAPGSSDIKQGSIVEELLARSEPANGSATHKDDGGPKQSPIVDLVGKRLKTTGKKISRIQTYASVDHEKLNDDQRRALKTLPSLEAVAKELDEVKKAIEVYEAEQTSELAFKALEASQTQERRIALAVAEAESATLSRVSVLLSLIRLHSLLAAGHPSASSVTGEDHSAIFDAVQLLLGEENESKLELIRGLLSGEGEFQGIPHSRFADLTEVLLNPSEAPTFVVEEGISSVPEASEPADALDASVSGLDVPASTSGGGFHFMQPSDLEIANQDQWTDVPPSVDVEITTITHEVPGTDEVVVEEVVTIAAEVEPEEIPQSTSGAFDWADDEGGLPPIAGLHAKFGTSGTPSPAEPARDIPPAAPEASGPASANGSALVDEDGFVQAQVIVAASAVDIVVVSAVVPVVGSEARATGVTTATGVTEVATEVTEAAKASVAVASAGNAVVNEAATGAEVTGEAAVTASIAVEDEVAAEAAAGEDSLSNAENLPCKHNHTATTFFFSIKMRPSGETRLDFCARAHLLPLALQF